MAQVGVTDDTVTLVGALKLDAVAAVRENATVGAGADASLTKTASTRGAAMTTGAATQIFFIERYDAEDSWFLKRCLPEIPTNIPADSRPFSKRFRIFNATNLEAQSIYRRPRGNASGIPGPRDETAGRRRRDGAERARWRASPGPATTRSTAQPAVASFFSITFGT